MIKFVLPINLYLFYRCYYNYNKDARSSLLPSTVVPPLEASSCTLLPPWSRLSPSPAWPSVRTDSASRLPARPCRPWWPQLAWVPATSSARAAPFRTLTKSTLLFPWAWFWCLIAYGNAETSSRCSSLPPSQLRPSFTAKSLRTPLWLSEAMLSSSQQQCGTLSWRQAAAMTNRQAIMATSHSKRRFDSSKVTSSHPSEILFFKII